MTTLIRAALFTTLLCAGGVCCYAAGADKGSKPAKPVKSAKTVKPAKAAKPAKPARCPTCGIKLAPKKTRLFYVPIKVKGKTFYCCPFCKMPPQKK
jgi:hypothetical protein